MEDEIDIVKKKYGFSFDLKDEQKKIIRSILDNKDTLGLLPTGFGKSVGYTFPPLVLDEKDSGKRHIALIVSSLRSLMQDQIDSLKSRGLRAEAITKKKEMKENVIYDIKKGNVQFVFCSPEALVQSEWFNVIRDVWKDSLCMICFDEAHCVSDWGESFRPEYRKVAMIRSIADVPVLALTATVTTKVKSDIEKYLYIKKDCNVIAAIPDRPNIHLQVQKSSSDFESELKWLLSSLERDISDSPKTLIFCRSIPTVAEIFLLFNDELGEKRFCGDFRLVEMFHSAISEDRKKLILDEFKKTDSKIRCVVATVAFGMGIDIPDIRNVVHWGAPKSILSYWQEVGRCARDGKDGVAVCYAYARSLHTNTTSADVVDMVKSTSCIRRVTLANFAIPGVTSVNHIVNPRCCCICDMDIWKH